MSTEFPLLFVIVIGFAISIVVDELKVYDSEHKFDWNVIYNDSFISNSMYVVSI